jgi:anti-sigma regulatory factor (Ser/Thr protein kinase)
VRTSTEAAIQIPNINQFRADLRGKTRCSGMTHSGFRHDALIYHDAEEFLAGTLPFLYGALEAGEPALVAVSQARTALLEGELGDDAREVRFVGMEDLGRNPARIIPFWRDFVDEHGGRPVRGIGEPVWPGRECHEIDECQRHESLLNVAFAEPPAWSLLCPYDGSSLPDDVLARVPDSHQCVGDECVSGGLEGDDCLAGELPGSPPVMDAFCFARDGLAHVRRRVEHAATLTGVAAHSTAAMIIAANEIAANSVVHGGGIGTMRIWRDDGRLVVEIEDRGLIEEQLVGRLRPTRAQRGGRGLWHANQLCDLVQIRSGTQGTTVRLHTAVTGTALRCGAG